MNKKYERSIKNKNKTKWLFGIQMHEGELFFSAMLSSATLISKQCFDQSLIKKNILISLAEWNILII